MRNKIVSGLIVTTGVLFTAAIFLKMDPYIEAKITLFQLGVVTGLSAVATRVLIKENN